MRLLFLVLLRVQTIERASVWGLWEDRPRRIPLSMLEEVGMLNRGVIQESQTPWSSNMVLVRKKNSGLMVCVDLNAQTVRDLFSLPCIDETLGLLWGNSWFSTLDPRSDFWQMEVGEEHREWTVFLLVILGYITSINFHSASVIFRWAFKVCCKWLSEVYIWRYVWLSLMISLQTASANR